MDQFVPADWRSGNMGDACATPRGQANGFVELLGHSQEHEVAPWFQFQYPAVDDDNGGSLGEDFFSEIFGKMPAASDTAGHCAPPRGVRASDATSYHDDASPTQPRAPGGEKRKQRDTDERPSKAIQDAEESDTAAMTTSTPAQGTATCKRRRAAQVHNLSERRRRDRINEKMRALQQLVPNCSNKTDRASMLDEAIQYLKSLQLQLQVQMMWTTGGVMAPAPASGAHRYMHWVASMSPRMPQLRTCVQNDARL